MSPKSAQRFWDNDMHRERLSTSHKCDVLREKPGRVPTLPVPNDRVLGAGPVPGPAPPFLATLPPPTSIAG